MSRALLAVVAGLLIVAPVARADHGAHPGTIVVRDAADGRHVSWVRV